MIPHSRKIFFDGALPAEKRSTREERLRASTRSLENFWAAYPSGIPGPLRPKDNPTSGELPLSSPSGIRRRQSSKPPIPAFLVPAVIDTLRRSSRFRSVIELVPGEADTACAHYLLSPGCTVMTADSDLLVYPSRHDSSVAFLFDVDPEVLASNGGRVRQYCGTSIAMQLGLNPDRGLVSLAAVLKLYPNMSFDEQVKETRTPSIQDYVDRNGLEQMYVGLPDYRKFPENYPAPASLQRFDPRISELVVASTLRTVRVPESQPWSFFAPLLLDSKQRKSAWEASTPIRRLAYWFLQRNVESDITEFRRLSHGSRGRLVEKMADDEHFIEVRRLIHRLDAHKEWKVTKPLQLDYLAVLYEADLAALSGGAPVVLDLLWSETVSRGSTNPLSWDSIHVTAQLQAMHYSLRILKQILEFALSSEESRGKIRLDSRHGAQARELVDRLGDLPGFDDYPTIIQLPNRLSSLLDLPIFEALREHTDIPRDALLAPSEDVLRRTGVGRKWRKRNKGPANQRKFPTQALSGNPFLVLSME